jgi:hypothetical protein
MFIKKIFKYFEPAWSGSDGKISLRAVLAIAFSVDFIRNLSHAIWKWDGGRSLEGLSLTLGIEAGLIVGLLGLTTYQNLSMINKTGSTDGYMQPNTNNTQTVQNQQVLNQQNADAKIDTLPKD